MYVHIKYFEYPIIRYVYYAGNKQYVIEGVILKTSLQIKWKMIKELSAFAFASFFKFES